MSIRRGIAGRIAGIGASLAVAACGSDARDPVLPPAHSTAPVASVSITPPNLSLVVGQSALISATPRDSAGNALTGRPVTWTSTPPGILDVNGGQVTALKDGGAYVAAHVDDKVGTANVVVGALGSDVATISISPNWVTAHVGVPVQFEAQAHNVTGQVLGGRTFNWTVTPKGIATITDQGVLTVHTPSNYALTVTAATGGRSASTVAFPVQ